MEVQLSHRVFQASFWLAVVITLYFTLRPIVVTTIVTDKTQHFATFAALAVLAALAHPRARLLPLGAALAGLGAAIELIQPIVGRSDDVYDWIADTLGVVLGLVLVSVGRALARRSAS